MKERKYMLPKHTRHTTHIEQAGHGQCGALILIIYLFIQIFNRWKEIQLKIVALVVREVKLWKYHLHNNNNTSTSNTCFCYFYWIHMLNKNYGIEYKRWIHFIILNDDMVNRLLCFIWIQAVLKIFRKIYKS